MCKTRIEEREQVERQNVPVTRKELLEILALLQDYADQSSVYDLCLDRWKLDKRYL